MARYTAEELRNMTDNELQKLSLQKGSNGKLTVTAKRANTVLYYRHRTPMAGRHCHVNIDLDYYELSGRYGER